MTALLTTLRNVIISIIDYFKNSRLARILIIIIVFKFIVFYGVLKAYIYPKYLKPKWESEQHRIDDVTNKLIISNKNKNND